MSQLDEARLEELPRLGEALEELRQRHSTDWIEPTPANLQWLTDEGYAHLAELIALLQSALRVEHERAERLERERDELKQLCLDADSETMMYYRMWCEATGRDPSESRAVLAEQEKEQG